MKKRYLQLLLCLIMMSCNKDGLGDKYYYEFIENRKLTINTFEESYMKYSTISDGDKTVFKYYFIAEDDEQIADDEYAEFIYFEIDSNLDSFLIEGDQLTSANLVLTKSCFCYWAYDSKKDVDPTGSISGKKTAYNKWSIDFNVTFYGNEVRSFNETFVLK